MIIFDFRRFSLIFVDFRKFFLIFIDFREFYNSNGWQGRSILADFGRSWGLLGHFGASKVFSGQVFEEGAGRPKRRQEAPKRAPKAAKMSPKGSKIRS